jgi:hypothetical protein
MWESPTPLPLPTGRGSMRSRGRCGARRVAPSVTGMNLLTKVFVSLAIACGASWLIKQIAIVATGGGDSESPIVAVLWATGMITFLLAAACGTALALRAIPTWARVLAAVVAVPVAFAAIEVADAVVDAVYQADGWFAQEVPLVLAALVMGALGLQTLNSARRA